MQEFFKARLGDSIQVMDAAHLNRMLCFGGVVVFGEDPEPDAVEAARADPHKTAVQLGGKWVGLSVLPDHRE